MSETINTFQEGLMMDAHPLTVPNTCLTNALNASIITFNGNEFVLQNDMGNGKVETAYLPAGYIPVGVKEYGGIIYIASYNPIKNQSQLGCFPSPERLISSDEVGLPKVNLTDTNFGLIENGTEGATSEYLKLEVFEPTQIFNPGDQFMIAIKHNDGAELNEVLSHYGKLEDGTIKGVQDITLSLAILDEVGNVTTIEDSLIKDPTTGYWMPPFNNSDITDLQNPEEFRKSIGGTDKYNIYKSKISGHLVLIVRLEGMKDFDFTRKVNIVDVEKDVFSVSFMGSSTKYTEDNSVSFRGYKFKYWLYEGSSNAPIKEGEIYRYNEDSKYKKDSEIKLELNAIDGEGFKRNQILKYEVIPFTDFLYLDRYKKTGLVDFSKIGTGIHNLTEWRYYIDNNSASLSFGFDYNPLDGYNVDEVFMEIYDVSADYSTYYPISPKDNWSGNFTETLEFIPRQDLSLGEQFKDIAKFMYLINDEGAEKYPDNAKDVIKLTNHKKYIKDLTKIKSDNFYIVRVCIREIFENDYKETEFLKYLYTTPTFNKEYNENLIQDFQTLKPKFNIDIKVGTIGNEYKKIYNEKETSNIFKTIISEEDKPGNILTSSSEAQLVAEHQVALSSVLVNKDRYFGIYDKDSLDLEFEDNQTFDCTVTFSEKEIKTIGLVIDTALDELAKVEGLNKADIKNSYIKKISKKKVNIKLLADLCRLLVGVTSKSSITYTGQRLEQYIPDGAFSTTYPIGNLNKKIGGLIRQGDNFTVDSCIALDWRTVVVTKYPGKNYISESYNVDSIQDHNFHKGMMFIKDRGFFPDTNIMLVTGVNGRGARYRVTKKMRGATSQWDYYTHNGDENCLDANDNWEMVAWKTIRKDFREYTLINMGTKQPDDKGIPWSFGGRKYNLPTALAKILNNFCLVQKGEFSNDILYVDNYAYHSDYNTEFNIKIKYKNNYKLLNSMFNFYTIGGYSINFYNDIEESISPKGLFGYLSSVLDVSYLEDLKILNQSNIPTLNYSDINVNNTNSSYITTISAGNSLKFSKTFRDLTDPLNTAKIKASSERLDWNFSDVDGNGDKYDSRKIYINNPNIAIDKTGYSWKEIKGIYPIDSNKIKEDSHKRGFYLKNVDGITSKTGVNGFFILGPKDTNFLVASYSIFGEDGLNSILLGDPDKISYDTGGTWWNRKGGDKDAVTFQKDITFNDTYNMGKITEEFNKKHNNRMR